MDLPTFFKDYQGIITVVSGLIIAILGFVFATWNSDRNRKLERRAAIHDMRIKEAREYVDVEFMLIRKISQMVSLMEAMKTNANVKELTEEFVRDNKTLESMVLTHSKTYSSIIILNDPRLNDLTENLDSIVIPLSSRIGELLENTPIGVKDYELAAFSTSLRRARAIITKLNQRLDKLASELK